MRTYSLRESLILIICFPLALLAAEPAGNKPVCAAHAICFSGKVTSQEAEFRRILTPDLEFVLAPGWTITIVPRHPEKDCDEFASVVTPPYRAHRDLDIDASYGLTAEDEVIASPREFAFVTNCRDYRTESARLSTVMWPYTYTVKENNKALAKLGSSRTGKGRLWITNSRITHAADTPDDKSGQIEWMEFTVEIILPRR